MKRITLASLRSDQPQLFEVLLKKNDLFLFFYCFFTLFNVL